jgi:hypothetical protein
MGTNIITKLLLTFSYKKQSNAIGNVNHVVSNKTLNKSLNVNHVVSNKTK